MKYTKNNRTAGRPEDTLLGNHFQRDPSTNHSPNEDCLPFLYICKPIVKVCLKSQ